MDKYLKCTNFIDCDSEVIQNTALKISNGLQTDKEKWAQERTEAIDKIIEEDRIEEALKFDVESIQFHLDGGTAEIETTLGTFFVDRRLGTESPLGVYNDYPGNKNARMVNDKRDDLLYALIYYAANNEDSGVEKLVKDMRGET